MPRAKPTIPTVRSGEPKPAESAAAGQSRQQPRAHQSLLERNPQEVFAGPDSEYDRNGWAVDIRKETARRSRSRFCKRWMLDFRMTLTDYRLDLGIFGGPMDLLLHLVRRHELDVCQVSLAKITVDFQQHLEVLQLLDLELIGDFIVTASILLEIKSREVLPVAEEETEDESEEELESSELIQKLLEYRRYKQAAQQLEDQAAEWLERYPRLTDDRPDNNSERVPDRVRGVEIWDLVSALARIVRIPSATEETTIRMDETPMSVHQDRIRRRLESEERVAFSDFFENEKVHARIVGIFQAILELIRHEQYRAEQIADHGEIWILPPLAEQAA